MAWVSRDMAEPPVDRERNGGRAVSVPVGALSHSAPSVRRAGKRRPDMTTFILIPGAGGAAWYWSRVAPLLTAAGHEAIAVDLPADDPAAGLSAYADLVVDAIGGRAGCRPGRHVARRLHGADRRRTRPAPRAGLRQRDDPGSRRDGRSMVGQHRVGGGQNGGGAEGRLRPGPSTSTHISCTTFRRRSRPKASNTSATRRTSCSASPARSPRGRGFRSMSSPVATTGSSPPTSSGASRASGWGRCRCPARRAPDRAVAAEGSRAVAPLSLTVSGARCSGLRRNVTCRQGLGAPGS